MPTYEYRCKDCGDDLEVVQSFHDDPLTECPSCGGKLKKVFGSIGISFKGSGFYKTDSRKGPSKDSSSISADKSSDKSSDSKTDTKSGDSKPEKKSSDSTSGSKKSDSKASASS